MSTVYSEGITAEHLKEETQPWCDRWSRTVRLPPETQPPGLPHPQAATPVPPPFPSHLLTVPKGALPASQQAGRRWGLFPQCPTPKTVPYTAVSHPAASSGPKRQQDSHATISSPAKQGESSVLHSAVIGQYLRAWLVNAVVTNNSLQFDSEIKRFRLHLKQYLCTLELSTYGQ